MSVWKKASPSTRVTLVVLLLVVFAVITVMVLYFTGVLKLDGSADVGDIELPTPAPGTPSVVALRDTNVLDAASAEAQVIGVLPAGGAAQLRGASEDSLWWEIVVPSQADGSGWVAAADVQVQDTALTSEPTAFPTSTPGVPTVTATSDAPVYTEPSEDSEVIGRLLAGQSAPVEGISPDGLWWLIQTDAGLGWVSEDLVLAESIENVVVVTPAPPQPSATPTAPAIVTAISNVNVRAGPSVDNDIVGLLQQGQSADALGINQAGSWWYIRLETAQGGVGWVSADFVEAENIGDVPTVDNEGNTIGGGVNIPTPAPNSPSGTAIANVNIRSGPGVGFELIGLLVQGQRVQIVGINGERTWWAINIPAAENGRGWVSGDYLTVENADAVPVLE